MATKWDDKVRGLGLRTYGSGMQTYVFRYRNHDGVEHLLKIGRAGEWSLAAARDRAKELRREIDRGGDPASDRRERREAATMQDLADRFVREVLPGRNAKARGLDYMAKRAKYAHDRELKTVGIIVAELGRHTPVASVHAGDMQALHRKFTEERGPARANRMISLASSMFALALVPMAGEDKPWRDQAQGNPCRGVKKNYEAGRQRFYSAQELARIAGAIETYQNETAKDCLRLVALTGARPQECRLARWEQFQEPGVWVKPSAHVKIEREHRLPLSPAAIELVERLRKRRKGEAPWLFPGLNPGQPVQTISHLWEHVKKHAGLEPTARVYDLRHSIASHAVAAGLSLPVIGALLGHTNAHTTQKYAHLADDPVRQAADRVGSVIGAAMNGNGKSGEVVELPRKAR
jgi:integrase